MTHAILRNSTRPLLHASNVVKPRCSFVCIQSDEFGGQIGTSRYGHTWSRKGGGNSLL